MRQLLRPLVLFAAIAGLTVAAGLPVAPAQVKDKKDEKKTDKKDVKKDAKKDEVGVVEVYMAKDGYRWRVRGADGKSIAVGTDGFAKKEDVYKILEAVKAAVAKGKVVELDEPKKK